jgi:hypothetical protein
MHKFSDNRRRCHKKLQFVIGINLCSWKFQRTVSKKFEIKLCHKQVKLKGGGKSYLHYINFVMFRYIF